MSIALKKSPHFLPDHTMALRRPRKSSLKKSCKRVAWEITVGRVYFLFNFSKTFCLIEANPVPIRGSEQPEDFHNPALTVQARAICKKTLLPVHASSGRGAPGRARQLGLLREALSQAKLSRTKEHRERCVSIGVYSLGLLAHLLRFGG